MKSETKNPATQPKSGVLGKNIDLLYAETSITGLESQKQAFSALPELQIEIANQSLSNCLEILAQIGFEGNIAILMLCTAQMLQGGDQ